MKRKLAIFAGEGSLPQIAVKNAKMQGYQVHALTLTEKTQNSLKASVHEAMNFRSLNLTKCTSYLQEHKITHALFIGKINKLYALSLLPSLVDPMALDLVKKLDNFSDNTIFAEVTKMIEGLGIQMVSQTAFLKDLLLEEGRLTSRELSQAEQADIKYGFDLAQKAARLDVSQTVVVKGQAAMALEAVEGTDMTIERGCRLAKKNAVIVKVPWRNQSSYFDLPAVGPDTIKTIAKHKGSVLAIKAHKTFVIDKEEMIRLAEKHHIAFLAI